MTQTVSSPRVISGLGAAKPEDEPKPSTLLPQFKLDPRTFDRALACVHCGLCLPACPTYTQNGLEADSPRGRIYLMKGLVQGKIEPTDSVIRHLDLCLDCRACETACPSGVVYHELIEETRAHLAGQRRTGLVQRLVNLMFFHIFPYPRRLKLAILPARILQSLGLWGILTSKTIAQLLPAQLEKMQQMLPSRRASLWEKNLEPFYPAGEDYRVDGKPRAVVALFAGCVGSVLYQHINRQTIDLLTFLGCDVVVKQSQRCCGAIQHHGGRVDEAEAFARANIDAFLTHGDGDGKPAVDYIVNNIAGCGAMLKDYPHLLRDDPQYARRAEDFAKRSRDVMELIAELDPPAPEHEVNRDITYHDACHLAHAQKVVAPPRKMLARVKGLNVKPLSESDMCCGAAGTYNLSQPQMARELAERKIAHIQKTGTHVCATGNVGCAMQIQSEADRLGAELEVVHPVSVLHEAYFGIA